MGTDQQMQLMKMTHLRRKIIVFTIKQLSQLNKPLITNKVILDFPHTNDMDNNNLSSQTP